MESNEDSEEFLSLVIKFLISIISLYMALTVFSHCIVMMLHPFATVGKAKDAKKKQLAKQPNFPRYSRAPGVIMYACKERTVLQGAQCVNVCPVTACAVVGNRGEGGRVR